MVSLAVWAGSVLCQVALAQAVPISVPPPLTWTAESDQESADFGGSVSSAGDVNGDGFADVIVGAPGYDNGMPDEGRAYVHLGSATGLATTAAWIVEPDRPDEQFGTSVATAGDVNGDGFADVIVGARSLGTGLGGRATLYLGSAAGLATTASWTAVSSQPTADFAGQVASAGDVNGDGFDDVIVGASAYDGGQTDEGRVSVFPGTPSGLGVDAAWTAEVNEASAAFGVSVASAGDVNGDGFGDVIVGASQHSNGEANEGGAYVFLGSAAGLGPTPAWAAESDQAEAAFGASVAAAGDVNGDGFGDVVVGALLFDGGESSEGAVFVYLGSAGGLAAAPAWMAESDQAGGQLGASVAAAGDLNGDGYGDLVVGANLYDGAASNGGRISVFLGSATGLGTSAAWTFAANSPGASLGQSVAPAGDVDGDGLHDLMAGGPNDTNGELEEGRAWVFPGAAFLDHDLDGSVGAADCDDDDPAAWPGAVEVCDGIDNSCFGVLSDGELDVDEDGVRPCEGDCDDLDPAAFPEAPEVCDGADNACVGSVAVAEVDSDGDGVAPCEGDCDEALAAASPNAAEICGNARDDNCDGAIDESCGEGAGADAGCGCDASGRRAFPLTILASLVVVGRRRPRRRA